MLAAMRPPFARALAGATLAFLVLAFGLPAAPGEAEELRVGAAASLRETVEAGARAFEAAHPGLRVRVSYGASSSLAAQIRAGAPLDVLLSADARIADTLSADGLADPPRALARNRLVAVAAPGVELREAEGLLQLERIAVPEHAVPVGRYAREWLASRGWLARLRERLIATEHARATLAAADHGAVDAALVYATDARLARRATLAFEVSADEQPEIVYAACTLRRRGASPRAAAFVDWWGSDAGRALLEAAGFDAAAP